MSSTKLDTQLQTVDVSLVHPLSTYYVAAPEKGTNNCPGHVVKTVEISWICDEACLEAASPVTAIKVLCMCGFLFDRNISSEANILAAEFTDQGDQSENFLQEAANTAERVNVSQTLTQNQNPETAEAGIAAVLISRPYKKIFY
jgi:hypothetical protein